MHLTWRAGLQLAAAGSAITLITMIGSVPVSAAPGGNPGPAGLLPALRGLHHGANDDGGGEVRGHHGLGRAVLRGPDRAGDQGQPGRVRRGDRRGEQARPLRRPLAGGHQPALQLRRPGLPRPDLVQLQRRRAAGDRPDDRARRGRQAPCTPGRPPVACGGPPTAARTGSRSSPSRTTCPSGQSRSIPADHSIWVGTGEPNTNQDSYAGNGIYRSADDGRTWQLVGNSLPNRLVYQITFDGVGHVYAATSYGPAPALRARPDVDVEDGAQAGSQPHELAVSHLVRDRREGAAGHRRERRHRGAGLARRHAADRHPVQRLLPVGQRRQDVQQGHADRRAEGRDRPRPDDVRLLRRRQAAVRGGRVHRHGRRSRACTSRPAATWPGRGSSSRTRRRWSTPGPRWRCRAARPARRRGTTRRSSSTRTTTTTSSSTSKRSSRPTTPGQTWTTTGPYWNFPLPCWNVDPAKDTCPGTVHADQHALAISGGTLYTANDGGVYAHPLRRRGRGEVA